MMNSAISTVWGLLACLMFASLAAAACPSNYVELEGSCFKFVQDAEAYSDAENACEAEGSTLADIANDSQMAALLDYVNAMFPGTFWTSGQFENRRYQWDNTESQVPQNMRGRSFRNSNGMCVYVCSRTSKLWDARCSTPKRFICKRNVQLDLEGVQVF